MIINANVYIIKEFILKTDLVSYRWLKSFVIPYHRIPDLVHNRGNPTGLDKVPRNRYLLLSYEHITFVLTFSM